MLSRRIYIGSTVAIVIGTTILFLAGGDWKNVVGLRRMGSQTVGASSLPDRIGLEDGYAGSQRCQECHREQYDSWHSTFHRTMTMPAKLDCMRLTAETITLQSPYGTYRLTRENDAYWVEMPDPDWVFDGASNPKFKARRIRDIPVVKKQIEMITGSHNQQCFWVASSRGRYLWMLPWSYHIAENHWYPLEDNFVRPPDAGRIFTRWDDNCIRCHTVAGNPHLDQRTGLTLSSVAELGITCEACHGAGAKHVALVTEKPLADAPDQQASLAIVNPMKLDAERSSHVCAQCHGVTLERDYNAWTQHGTAFRPGEDLRETRHVIAYEERPKEPWLNQLISQEPSFMRNMFWPDGTVRVAGRDYNAMQLSPCYAGGKLSCLSCHSMHSFESSNDQLSPKMDTNAACLQCHAKFADRIEEHTHHRANSEGSICYNCHMPHTTFGLMKCIRSHRITSPNVSRESSGARPNACNLCHLDKTKSWAARALQQWYGIPNAELAEDERNIAASIVWLLKGDAAQRAVTAWHFGWAPAQIASGKSWQAPYLALLMEDPYSVVRQVAFYSLRTLPAFSDHNRNALSNIDERTLTKKHIIEQWKANLSRSTQFPDQLLLKASGEFDLPKVSRLRRERNDMPVSIRE